MGLRIATNVSSLTSQRHLRNTRRALDKSLKDYLPVIELTELEMMLLV